MGLIERSYLKEMISEKKKHMNLKKFQKKPSKFNLTGETKEVKNGRVLNTEVTLESSLRHMSQEILGANTGEQVECGKTSTEDVFIYRRFVQNVSQVLQKYTSLRRSITTKLMKNRHKEESLTSDQREKEGHMKIYKKWKTFFLSL